MLFSDVRRGAWRKHCLSCLFGWCSCHCCRCTCALSHSRLFSFWCCFGSWCPNMCSASLFSLAIHCLTAEVFFQPFKTCTLKFPAKDNQVCILLYLPVLSLCTLSSSPGCLAASPLGLSLMHTMNHEPKSNSQHVVQGDCFFLFFLIPQVLDEVRLLQHSNVLFV